MIVGAAIALALASGSVAVAAMPTSSSGTLAGEAWFAQNGARGVVEVFNPDGRLLARRHEHYPRGRFRFVLEPGRYKVKLKMGRRWHWFAYCPHEKTARVHANHTTHITLSQGCANEY
jgi:hypothetical protein